MTETEEGTEVKFETSGVQTAVLLGDYLAGITTRNEIIVKDIVEPLTLALVPLSEDVRGERVEVVLTPNASGHGELQETADADFVPKTPNTGAR